MSKQYIYDGLGNIQFVVLPVTDYEQLLAAAGPGWSNLDYAAAADDDETIPQEVVSIMVDQDVSLQAAWRIHRGLSQYEVAEKLGATQSAVSQWERADSKPQRKTRERLARLYACRPEQLLL